MCHHHPSLHRNLTELELSKPLQASFHFCLLTLSCSSLRRNETGCPWRFPDEVVRGVLMSAWASTQITQRSGQCWAWPLMVPIARLQRTNTVILKVLCLANYQWLSQPVQLTLPSGPLKQGLDETKSPWTYSFQRLILSELGGNGRLWRFKTNHWLPLQCDKWYCCPQIHIIWSISPGPEKYFKYLFNEWNPVKWCVLYVTSHKYCLIHVKVDQGDLIISKRSINFLRVKISIVM